MATYPYLEYLAPEILIEILWSASSLHDVYALTMASPACHRVFQMWSKYILPPVLAREMDSSTLRDFLAIFHIRSLLAEANDKMEKSAGHNDVETKKAIRTQIILDFLDRYWSDQTFELPPNVDQYIPAMRRLSEIVARLIDQYFAYITPRRHGFPGFSPSLGFCNHALFCPKDPTSPTDRAQIQQALLRYELFTSMFPLVPHFDTKNSEFCIPTESRIRFYTNTLTGGPLIRLMNHLWLIDVDAIQHFLADLANGYMMDIEDQFIQALSSCQFSKSSPRKRLHEDADIPPGDDGSSRNAKRRKLSTAPTNQPEEKEEGAHSHDEATETSSGRFVCFSKEAAAQLPVRYIDRAETLKYNMEEFAQSLAFYGLEFSLSLMDADPQKRRSLILARERQYRKWGREVRWEAFSRVWFLRKKELSRPGPRSAGFGESGIDAGVEPVLRLAGRRLTRAKNQLNVIRVTIWVTTFGIIRISQHRYRNISTGPLSLEESSKKIGGMAGCALTMCRSCYVV
ncbi:hypothetical protein V8F33_008236 [Rhypophila sp. PSN 637]